MSTIYTLNGKVLKNSANDKWLTKKEAPPTPSYIVPDGVPDPDAEQGGISDTSYYGPLLGGNKLDYNTTYQINYPTGITINNINIYTAHGSGWEYRGIVNGSPSSITTLKLSDYLTSSQWNDTQILCITLKDSSSQTIYEPTTLTPVS